MNKYFLDRSREFIKRVIPSHTDKKLKFEKLNFVNISVDSLNQMLSSELVKNIEVESNNIFQLNGKEEKKVKWNYPFMKLIW